MKHTNLEMIKMNLIKSYMSETDIFPDNDINDKGYKFYCFEEKRITERKDMYSLNIAQNIKYRTKEDYYASVSPYPIKFSCKSVGETVIFVCYITSNVKGFRFALYQNDMDIFIEI